MDFGQTRRLMRCRLGGWNQRLGQAAIIPPMSMATLAMLIVVSGCAPRGRATIDASAQTVGEVVPIYVATSRQATTGYEIYNEKRSDVVGYAKFDISVPPERKAGTVTYPKSLPPDPQSDFFLTSAVRYSGADSFRTALNSAITGRPARDRQVAVFVHGFNNNFAEGLYRHAQILHDVKAPSVAVHYSWPSAGDTRLYVYDRDSALFARDGLITLLETLATSNADGIVLFAHSMGTQVVTDTLRDMSLAGSPALAKLRAVILLSPDIDVDLFRSEAERLKKYGLAWYIFVSKRDKALGFSSFIRGGSERLGDIRDVAEIDDLDVTVIDLTNVKNDDPLGHETVAQSPVMIALIRGINENGLAIIADDFSRQGLLETSASIVNNVTEIAIDQTGR